MHAADPRWCLAGTDGGHGGPEMKPRAACDAVGRARAAGIESSARHDHAGYSNGRDQDSLLDLASIRCLRASAPRRQR
jgi:hypothetical protein